jgi:acetyl-CoA carboxylase carboxyl transferase subunit alpha
VADRVLILQNAYYSVISPEGCASILWRSSTKAPEAANALKLTGEHLLKFGIVDEVVAEPEGGAHRDPEAIAAQLKKAILKNIKELTPLSPEELLDQRYEKFRRMGHFQTAEA